MLYNNNNNNKKRPLTPKSMPPAAVYIHVYISSPLSSFPPLPSSAPAPRVIAPASLVIAPPTHTPLSGPQNGEPNEWLRIGREPVNNTNTEISPYHPYLCCTYHCSLAVPLFLIHQQCVMAEVSSEVGVTPR